MDFNRDKCNDSHLKSAQDHFRFRLRNFDSDRIVQWIIRFLSLRVATRIVIVAIGCFLFCSFLLATAPQQRSIPIRDQSTVTGLRLLDVKSYSTNPIRAKSSPKVTTVASPVKNKSYPNSHPYRFTIMEEDICSKRRPDLFIITVVHTAPKNFKKRMVIRDTWGSQRLYHLVKTVVIFALGRSGDPKTDQMVLAESRKYRDIIQEDFLDSYKNLSLKGVMWLNWVSHHCSQASFILKADDDIFVNIFNLVTHLNHLQTRKQIRPLSIMCLLWTRMPVLRDRKSKWFVNEKEFSEKFFPKYCSGSAFVLTRELIYPMYLKSFVTPFFWVDDVYLTGFLPRNISGVEHKSIASLYVLKQAELQSKLVNGFALFGHIAALETRYSIWKDIIEQRGLTSEWSQDSPLQ